MMQRQWLGAVLGLTMVVQTALAQAPVTTSPARLIIDRWLTCVECSDGELDSLRRLAIRLPTVVDTLHQDLFNGPSPARRANLTRQLDATYARLDSLARREKAERLTRSQTEFVQHYLRNMLDIYQGQAARGLGGIGGRRAAAVLDSALSLPRGTFTPVVLRQIRIARDSIRR